MVSIKIVIFHTVFVIIGCIFLMFPFVISEFQNCDEKNATISFENYDNGQEMNADNKYLFGLVIYSITSFVLLVVLCAKKITISTVKKKCTMLFFLTIIFFSYVAFSAMINKCMIDIDNINNIEYIYVFTFSRLLNPVYVVQCLCMCKIIIAVTNKYPNKSLGKMMMCVISMWIILFVAKITEMVLRMDNTFDHVLMIFGIIVIVLSVYLVLAEDSTPFETLYFAFTINIYYGLCKMIENFIPKNMNDEKILVEITVYPIVDILIVATISIIFLLLKKLNNIFAHNSFFM